MQKPEYAVVVQSVRHNDITGKKTLYVLGVKLAGSKEAADRQAELEMKAGFITDVLPVTLLTDLV